MLEGAPLPVGSHAVVLLHGLYSSSLELQYVGRRLRAAGFAVYTPHIPGYSVTQGKYPASAGRWEDWLAAARHSVVPLLERHERVSIGGLCIGADLALMLAAEYGARVDSLLLLSTTLYYDGWSLPWYRFLLPLAYYTPLGRLYAYEERDPFGLKNEQMRRLVAAEMKQRKLSQAGADRLHSSGLFQAQRLIRAVKRALPGIRNPALIVHAIEDDMTSLRSVRLLEQRLGSERVETMLLGNSYHMVSLDNEKDHVADRMIEFLGLPAAQEERVAA
jgi:carboxylesterase